MFFNNGVQIGLLKWHNKNMETKEEFIANYKNSVNNGEIIIDKNCRYSVEKIAEALYQIKKDIVEDFKRADLATKNPRTCGG